MLFERFISPIFEKNGNLKFTTVLSDPEQDTTPQLVLKQSKLQLVKETPTVCNVIVVSQTRYTNNPVTNSAIICDQAEHLLHLQANKNSRTS